MESRTQKRREKRQEQLEKVQLFYHKFSIVATVLKMLCSPTLIPSENYIKERNETQMENKRPRGRPATGRLRDKQMNFMVTEEKNKIKEYVKEHNTTITQLILDKINENQK